MSRILGAPSWVKTQRFDIEAKVAEADVPKLDKLMVDQRGLMLRPLLEDRFNLKFHQETKDLLVKPHSKPGSRVDAMIASFQADGTQLAGL